jgi:non-haem Fe2+, alpha-ketoglutarate-dependent halogenase
MLDSTSRAKKFRLEPHELRSFHDRGYAGPFTLYEPDVIKALWRRERIRLMDRSRAVYQDVDAVSGVTNIANYDRHLDNDFLAEHIGRPEIVDRVADIMGDDLLCWRTEFFPKYPGDEGTDWHQADTFANASGTPQIIWPENRAFGGTITAWAAFSDVDMETACLQFIPGTHRTMFYDETKRMQYDPKRINREHKEGMRRGFFGYDYRQLQKDADWSPDESKAVPMIMKAGQFILFWSTMMHASYPHVGKTKQTRMAFVSRYVPTEVKVYPDTEFVEEYGGKISLEKYGSVLVAGENHFDYNRIATHTTTGKPFRAELRA